MCLALMCLAFPDSSVRAAVSVTDDLGETVRLDGPAQRIIALYGALNEILAAMGLEDRIVARTQSDRLPPSILDKPSIGTHMRPNIELVLGLKPDLVLQMGGREQAVRSVTDLKRFGVNTAMFKADSFASLYSVIERLGVLTGEPERARALMDSMKNRLERVRGLLKRAGPAPRVFFEVRYPNLLGVGQGSIVNDVILGAGGVNCLASPKKFVRIGEEELLRLAPEVYLIQKGPMNPSPIPLAQRPHYQTLPAVDNGRIFVIDEQKFSRPGPRNADAVETLAELLHPGLFD